MKYRHAAREAFAACPAPVYRAAGCAERFVQQASVSHIKVKLMSTAERLVPVPSMSPAGSTVLSEIRTSQQPSRALHDAVAAERVPAGDLPEIIANIWTRDDSPTTGLSESGWLEIFRAAGFFTYPPLAVRRPDGSAARLERPAAPVTLYRGSTADRMLRMSWTSEPAMAEQLGIRHTFYDPTFLYQATAAPDAVLAYLERRAEGWTVVVDPARLTDIRLLRELRGPSTPG
jgi:hypothetical protein